MGCREIRADGNLVLQKGRKKRRENIRTGQYKIIFLLICLKYMTVLSKTYNIVSWVYNIELTPEQHGFELCGSTYKQVVFNKYIGKFLEIFEPI